MPLTPQTPQGFISSIQGAIAAATTKLTNFSPGSAIAALIQAFTAQLLFIQTQLQYVYEVTRAATSTGADLTSFVTDYGLTPTRVAAVPAGTQLLIFSTYQNVTTQQVIPVGTIVQTPTAPPGTPVQFEVIADATNVNYNPALGPLVNGVPTGGYAIAVGTNLVAATAQCTVAGTVGNLLAGQLTVIVSSGVPAATVNNSAPITNGLNQESDAALLVRFGLYISSLAKASYAAIAAAILGVQTNLTYTIQDQSNSSVAPSTFAVYIDDGSGATPATTVTNVSNAINLVRAAGISFQVYLPTNITITVVVSGTVIAPSFVASTVRAAIQAAMIAYINANGVGGANLTNSYVPSLSLSYAGIAAVVETFIGSGSTQGLLSYTTITVNGGSSNVALTAVQLARATIYSVTVD